MSKILITTGTGEVAIKSDTIVAVSLSINSELYTVAVNMVAKGHPLALELFFKNERDATASYARLHQYV